MSNLLGEKLAAGLPKTLGAVRRVKDVTWIPGAKVDVWTPCASVAGVTGVPWPHVLFVQTMGESTSLFCEACVLERREAGGSRRALSETDEQTEVFA